MVALGATAINCFLRGNRGLINSRDCLLNVSTEAAFTCVTDEVLKKFANAGFVNAAVIGVMREGKARVMVR